MVVLMKIFLGKEKENFLQTKYPFVVHAEQNAILNSKSKSLDKCRIYVNLYPCHDCARNIIQSGIREVIYLSNKYEETDSIKASKMMFEKSGVKLTQLTPQTKEIIISLRIEDM